MKEFLFVGLGGAIGAMLRYGISMVPVKSEFPYMTLLINFLGAIAIGILAAMSMRQSLLTEHSLLLLKTGVCGGFTTFSTFSLEAVSLLEQHKTGMGIKMCIRDSPADYGCASVWMHAAPCPGSVSAAQRISPNLE